MNFYGLDANREENIIDVAKDYTCAAQTDAFNENYRKWRKDSSFGFHFVKDTNLLVYIDGKGFVDDRPEKAEKKFLSRNMYIIGMALCIYFLLEALLPYLAAYIMNLLGYNISNDFVFGIMNATSIQYTSISAIIAFIKIIIPTMLLVFIRKTPINLIFPLKVTNKEAAGISVPIVLMICGVSLCCSFFWGRTLDIFSIDISPAAVKIGNDIPSTIISAVAYIVIFPVLKELFLRGAIMQSLRQFGDGFALIFTSIISALLRHDISHIWFVLLTSFCIGYVTLCTGSVLCGIFADMFISLVVYLISATMAILPQDIFMIFTSIIILSFMITGLFFFYVISKNKEDTLVYKFPRSYMPLNDKLTVALMTPTMLLWVVAGFVFMTISARFMT